MESLEKTLQVYPIERTSSNLFCRYAHRLRICRFRTVTIEPNLPSQWHCPASHSDWNCVIASADLAARGLSTDTKPFGRRNSTADGS